MPAATTFPQIKGYLPVRLQLSKNDETFFFVREHHAGKSSSTTNVKPGCTLFVANAPVVPGISTKILLRSIFGRYSSSDGSSGEIVRVTVVQNPRQRQEEQEKEASIHYYYEDWSSTKVTSLPPIHCEGKFAHIVFRSSKVLKRTMNELGNIMKQKFKNEKDNKPGLILDRLELQTLADETSSQYQQSMLSQNHNDNYHNDHSDNNSDEDGSITHNVPMGIHAVAERYKNSRSQLLNRTRLLEECNVVMESYEKAEEEKRKSQETAKEQPDDDGFITVSYSTAVGSKAELEESVTATTAATIRRKAGNRRSRKKKEATGSSELKDFYRFQRKENKKRTLDELRTQFEEDLKKVKRMKEENQYRPF